MGDFIMTALLENHKTVKLTLPAIYYNAIVKHEYIGLTIKQIKHLNHILVINSLIDSICNSEYNPYYNDKHDLVIYYEFKI
jgi:hypothetical protein